MKEGERQPKPDLLSEVNEYLKSKTPEGMEIPTVQEIAGKLGVDRDTLNHWIETDEDFAGGLIRLKETQDNGSFVADEFENRVDSLLVAFLVLDTKSKYFPKD
jgi:transposase-like protein